MRLFQWQFQFKERMSVTLDVYSLTALKNACPTLINPFQLHRVNDFNYSMISEIQKGLAAALSSVFLRSHITHCVLYIKEMYFKDMV